MNTLLSTSFAYTCFTLSPSTIPSTSSSNLNLWYLLNFQNRFWTHFSSARLFATRSSLLASILSLYYPLWVCLSWLGSRSLSSSFQVISLSSMLFHIFFSLYYLHYSNLFTPHTLSAHFNVISQKTFRFSCISVLNSNLCRALSPFVIYKIIINFFCSTFLPSLLSLPFLSAGKGTFITWCVPSQLRGDDLNKCRR